MLTERALEESREAAHHDFAAVPPRLFGWAGMAVPGMLLVIACLLPYLNKAYTIDDPMFLLSARQILRSPLQPMSFERCWDTNETCVKSVAKVGAGASEALMGYLLVPVILAGGAEWMTHWLQILLACIAVLEMVRLALRLGFDRVQSAAAGLMLAAIPPFLPMANTAMPDIAALALGLTGMEWLLAWKDRTALASGGSRRGGAGARSVCSPSPGAASAAGSVVAAG